MYLSKFLMFFAILFMSPASLANEAMGQQLDLTTSWYGVLAILVFVIAYSLVIGEEFLHLRKSKPVLVSAGIIWALVGIAYTAQGDSHTAEVAVSDALLEYGELLLFLLAAMTYINTMQERNVFEAIRAWLCSAGFTYRTIFWITGLLAFLISPLADNLTTSLLMAAVVMSVGVGRTRFVTLSLINIVVAANAGGAFSPFGDITTLMVWQKGVVQFTDFFKLFAPSLVNWLVPALILSLAISKGKPDPIVEKVEVKFGGFVIIGLFVLTISMAVAAHNFLHLPPVLGMMTGLGLLQFWGYRIRMHEKKDACDDEELAFLESAADIDKELLSKHYKRKRKPFDIFISMKRAEWDTLMFFYGVVLSVAGLGTLGYLALLSEAMYTGLGPTWANILVGLVSAIVDNIPVMYAVLTMQPDMSQGQWLLVTLTAGVGGSLLSIGSAAGVALMGQARGLYTFFVHLRWSWAIGLGYAASIWVHFLVNAKSF
ncbi:MAG: sodium:proton antiporter NhaD [Gammaproteobacteria bacterium]|nr:MAG: sodium:proton antiporter NhaD [Gammaproteobacteria bacterium]